MTAKEIRELSTEEIVEKIKDGKSELLELRMKNGSGNLEHPHKLKALKKDIARMMTVLKERELNGGQDGK